MNLEKQVCTPEQATRLKQLGIPQKSLFYFHPKFPRPVFGETIIEKNLQVCNDKTYASSAFTAAELIVMHGNSTHFFSEDKNAAETLAGDLLFDIRNKSTRIDDIIRRLKRARNDK